MTSERNPKITTFVDEHLLSQAQKGNRLAISELCGIAAEHFEQLSAECSTENQALYHFVIDQLRKIAEGDDPNTAFGWSKPGAQPKNDVYLLWHLAQFVKDVSSQVGQVIKAIEVVGEAALLDGRKGGLVEKAYLRYKDVDLPEDIFPIDPASLAKVKLIEERLQIYLNPPKQK